MPIPISRATTPTSLDENSYQKAALLRRWADERFAVELGNWSLELRGPHVTPSFYFGFSNELLPVRVPWLPLSSLGLTILIHPIPAMAVPTICITRCG